MAYELLYTRRAIKDIEALDPVARRRLGKKLEEFRSNPLAFSQPLIHSSLGQYRFRVGDYGVIFDLHGSKIVVLRAGHRREIYR